MTLADSRGYISDKLIMSWSRSMAHVDWLLLRDAYSTARKVKTLFVAGDISNFADIMLFYVIYSICIVRHTSARRYTLQLKYKLKWKYTKIRHVFYLRFWPVCSHLNENYLLRLQLCTKALFFKIFLFL